MSKYGYFGDAGAPLVSGDSAAWARDQQSSFNPKPYPESRDAVDPRGAQAMALFMQLDERGKRTALAMLAVAVKLHAEPNHG